MRLTKALKQCGFQGEPDEIRTIILEQFQSLFPGETYEDVLFHPSTKALALCDAVRRHFRVDFPEDLVLRTLINSRKASQRSPESM